MYLLAVLTFIGVAVLLSLTIFAAFKPLMGSLEHRVEVVLILLMFWLGVGTIGFCIGQMV